MPPPTLNSEEPDNRESWGEKLESGFHCFPWLVLWTVIDEAGAGSIGRAGTPRDSGVAEGGEHEKVAVLGHG